MLAVSDIWKFCWRKTLNREQTLYVALAKYLSVEVALFPFGSHRQLYQSKTILLEIKYSQMSWRQVSTQKDEITIISLIIWHSLMYIILYAIIYWDLKFLVYPYIKWNGTTIYFSLIERNAEQNLNGLHQVNNRPL